MKKWPKAFALSALCLAPAAVLAQEDVRVGVLERLRPAYDPHGLRAGAFDIQTGVKVTETYTDNVYASEDSRTADFITSVAPDIKVSSRWSRHALTLRGGLDADYYAQEKDENTLGFHAGAEGRLDILRGTALTVAGEYRRDHESRAAPDAESAAAEPAPFDTLMGDVELSQRFNRLTLSLGGRYEQIDYSDVDRIGGGTIDNDIRDREIYSGRIRAGYDVSPDTEIYAQAEYNQRRYEEADPDIGEKRDSDGYEVRAGISTRLSALIKGDIFGGYREQSYDADALGDVSGFTYGTNLIWYATPLTNLRFTALSELDETTETGASGIERNEVTLAVDHELLRNFILTAEAGYALDDFTGAEREDETLTFGFGGTYLFNRHLRGGFDYRYITRESNEQGESYDENRIGVFLRTDL